MRLFLDENLSEAMIARLADTFPDVLHVRTLGLGGANDSAIWSAAREHDAMLVTRDEDFRHFSIRLGAPPKVIWVGLPNCSTAEVIRVLRSKEAVIRQFANDPDTTFLAIS
jgi:predicted nuclease of predicted toxin-antitoxin system